MIDLVESWESLCAMKCLPPAGIATGSLFPWILWALWKARNRFVFEGFSSSPEDTLTSAIVLAREWNREQKPEKSSVHLGNRVDHTFPSNTIVVRTDAAWTITSQVAGLGWVVLSRRHIQTFKEHMEFVPSPRMSEVLALRKAINSKRMKMKALRFESDSSQLIRLSTPDLHRIVSDIVAFISDFEFVCFVWIPRERNTMADLLSKDALIASARLVAEDALIVPN